MNNENQKLARILEFASKVTSTFGNLEKLLGLIMSEVRSILDAERCTIFIKDAEKNILRSKLADGVDEIEIQMGEGIAGTVALTGKHLYIPDAYRDPRFNKEVDSKTGFKTKSILAMPLKNERGEIIGVFQVLNKKDGNFDEEDVKILSLMASYAAGAIENTMLYEEQQRSFESFIETLSTTLDKRDSITAGHSKRVTYFSLLLGRKLALPGDRLEILKWASWMHDLGKIGVREAILTKDGKLTDEEYEKIKEHAAITKQILEKIYFKKEFREIPFIAASHHENYDGSGYPAGISGVKIPFCSRIIAVCDVFDAITSSRHYRKPMPIFGVLDILKKGKGTKFDPLCVDGFFKISLEEILYGINLEKVRNFVILSEDREVLSGRSLEDLWNYMASSHPGKFIDVFLKYYGR